MAEVRLDAFRGERKNDGENYVFSCSGVARGLQVEGRDRCRPDGLDPAIDAAPVGVGTAGARVCDRLRVPGRVGSGRGRAEVSVLFPGREGLRDRFRRRQSDGGEIRVSLPRRRVTCPFVCQTPCQPLLNVYRMRS